MVGTHCVQHTSHRETIVEKRLRNLDYMIKVVFKNYNLETCYWT